MKGRVGIEDTVVGSSSHLQSCIRFCIQAKFAWERCWCHSSNSFWELDKFWFAVLSIVFVWATSAAEYAKASVQKEIRFSPRTKGKRGKWLCEYKCACRINPFLKHTSTFRVVLVVWSANVKRRTRGLGRQTSMPVIWYPGRSRLKTQLARSSTFYCSKPSPATVFDKDKYMIFMLLVLYMLKSKSMRCDTDRSTRIYYQ